MPAIAARLLSSWLGRSRSGAHSRGGRAELPLLRSAGRAVLAADAGALFRDPAAQMCACWVDRAARSFIHSERPDAWIDRPVLARRAADRPHRDRADRRRPL